MGTINYKTSKYITMGAYPRGIWDFDHDEVVEDMLLNGFENITDAEYNEYVEGLIAVYEEDDYDNAKSILDDYHFENFSISIECGYYQGLSLMIEYEHDGWDFYDMEGKNNAKKEVERVHECLKSLAGVGLVACYPAWGTRYEDYNGTLEAISEACDEMLEDVRKTDVERFSWEV